QTTAVLGGARIRQRASPSPDPRVPDVRGCHRARGTNRRPLAKGEGATPARRVWSAGQDFPPQQGDTLLDFMPPPAPTVTNGLFMTPARAVTQSPEQSHEYKESSGSSR